MAASLITPAILREHVETDLSDDALQRIIDAEEAEIIRRFGENATQVEEFAVGGLPLLFLSRPVASITSVVERVSDDDTTLTTNDYHHDGRNVLRRIYTDADNPANTWGGRVTVTYVPRDMNAQRIKVLIDVCRLNLQYTGLEREAAGDYAATNLDFTMEREKLFAQLRTWRRWFA